jgi:Ser-tRNA(Ala) deacylase AlaX
MCSHTAAHALAAILERETGALITGNQLEEDKVRFDFNLENFSRELFQTYIDKVNELFKKDMPVKWYELPREEAIKIPGMTKLANALPPNIPVLRIVEIQGLDKQADGGTHVKNLKEVGAIEMIKAKNKGKNNRRVYFRVTN